MNARYSVPRWVCPVLVAVIALLRVPDARARSLSFAERIDCQRSVEEVYWRHRTWPGVNPGPKPVLQQVLSDDDIRAKVEETLRKSAALEQWGRPITADMLRSEIDRMARDTRRPDMLAEVFAALGDDPSLIAECFIRPILADRLVEQLAAVDASFGSWREHEGSSASTGWNSEDMSLAMEPPSPSEMPLSATVLQTTVTCQNDTWSPTTLSGAPSARPGHAAVWTGSEMIV